MFDRALLLLAGTLSIASCASVPTMESGGFTVERPYTEAAFDNVRNRAAFELSCPKEQLQLVVINVAPSCEGRIPSTLGVEGCGHRAVYVHVRSDAGWVMSSADGQPEVSRAEVRLRPLEAPRTPPGTARPTRAAPRWPSVRATESAGPRSTGTRPRMQRGASRAGATQPHCSPKTTPSVHAPRLGRERRSDDRGAGRPRRRPGAAHRCRRAYRGELGRPDGHAHSEWPSRHARR